MNLNLASAQTRTRSPLSRALARKARLAAANDNTLPGSENESSAFPFGEEDQLLQTALRHFAEHGLNAAREARGRAEKAFFAGDREAYDRWLGICRILDRRLAQQLCQSAQ